MHRFDPAELKGVYRAIYERRDIRSYRPDPIPEALLARLFAAAHRAGSVGYMQPWNFLLIREAETKRRLYDHFREVNERAAAPYEGDRQARYRALKLQGLLDAPLHVLFTCDTRRGGPHVLGRATIRETDVYSTCLAVQNFWLAARAEGVGVGWMSLMEPAFVCDLLGLPEGVLPVAYMTVGYPVEFPARPMLESVGWGERLPLEGLVFAERWGRPDPTFAAPAEADAEAPVAAPALPASASFEPPVEAVERARLLTKPEGSLGELDRLALKLAGIRQTPYPAFTHKHLLLFAGDHGVAAEGVSAYGPHVTAQMVYQFVAGGGAVNAFARQNGLALHVVDMGVDHDFAGAAGVHDAKQRRGTRSFVHEPAMTEAECEGAIAAGRAMVERLDALDLLALGEMGIGNSTAATALVCALLGLAPETATGMGTGVGARTRARKAAVVAAGLERHAAAASDPTAVLQRLGGYEIAGLVGAMEAASERRVPIVLDGFIVGAAALVAVRRTPAVLPCLIAGHRSAEPAHALVLDALGLTPLLTLDLRLGEGSGAALAMGLVEAAARTMHEMRTFEEANIPDPLVPEALN